jgi:hypothetical protein
VISLEFVAEHFDELEADFQREYGIDLRHALWGEEAIGARRLVALITGLSPQSATMRAVNTGGREWSTAEELLATLVELVDQTNRLLFQAHFEGDVWEPVQVPRPYQREKVVPYVSDPDEVLSFFGTMAASDHVFVDNPDAAVSSSPEVTD